MPTAASAALASPPPPEFLPITFRQLYPIFLLRTLPEGKKASLWNRYFGRWVRWNGRIASFTPNGITLRQRPGTLTFDVSLWLGPGERARARRELKVGERVTYVGMLSSYDDIWRTLYLIHGAIAWSDHADAGSPPGPKSAPSPQGRSPSR